MIAVMLRGYESRLRRRAWMNGYRYSESEIPWWVERHRNRNVTFALPLLKSMMSVLETKSTNVGGITELRDSFLVQLLHKVSRIVPVVAPWTSSQKSSTFLSPRT